MWKNRIIILSILLLIFVTSACSAINTNSEIENNNVVKSVSEDREDILEFINKLITSIDNVDAKAFKELVDEDGLYSIDYFIDQRDSHKVIHVYKDEIRDDLVLANSEGRGGISLSGMFAGDNKYPSQDILIHTNAELSNISFNVDWHINDERLVEDKLEDIVDTCRNINLINNEYIPQVFVLKDNMFVYTRSSVILEPYPQFTGEWVIFEKVGSEYKLRSVMIFE